MNQRELSTQLEVSEATVSRLGSGHRKPSLPLMERVSTVLRWKMAAQFQALKDGTYPEQFRTKMAERKPPRAAASD